VVGLLIVALQNRNVTFQRGEISPGAWLVLLWTIAPVVLLFLASYITPVFLPRYFSVALPGLALSTAWVLNHMQPRSVRWAIVVTLIAGVILDAGLRPRHAPDNWRGAMAAVRGMTSKESLPILVRSYFIESANKDTLNDPQWTEFLLAPQMIYPAPGKLILLPIRPDDVALNRLDGLVPLLGKRFIIVSSSVDRQYQSWLRGRLPSFNTISLGNFGTVSADLFTSQAAPEVLDASPAIR